MTIFISIQSKGGPGSGNWGHRGIPGKVGGSSPRGAGLSPTSGKDWLQRYEKRTGKKHPSVVVEGHEPTQVGLNAGVPGDNSTDEKASEMLSQLVGMDWESVGSARRLELEAATIDVLSERAGIDKFAVNAILAKWEWTSNNDSPQALSIQEAVAEEFDVPLSDWQKGKVTHVNNNADVFGSTVKGYVPRSDERKLLRAMHDNTQDELKKAGYKPGDTINLHRGYMTTRREDRSVGGVENYQGNAIGSWSVGHKVGQRFANTYTSETMHGIVASMSVPIENILSMSTTGFGTSKEGEFVVLGSKPGNQIRVTYAT